MCDASGSGRSASRRAESGPLEVDDLDRLHLRTGATCSCGGRRTRSPAGCRSGGSCSASSSAAGRGANWIRSRCASARQAAGSAVPWSRRARRPPPRSRFQIAVLARRQLALAAVGVLERRLDLVIPSSARMSRSKYWYQPAYWPPGGRSKRREQASSSSSSWEPSRGSMNASAIVRPGRVHDRGARIVDLAVEVAVEAAAAVVRARRPAAAASAAACGSGACEPLSSCASSGTVSIARTSWVAAAFIAEVTVASDHLPFFCEALEVLVEQVDALGRAVAAPLVVGGAEALGATTWFQLVIVPSLRVDAVRMAVCVRNPCHSYLPVPLVGQAGIDARRPDRQPAGSCTRRRACCRCRRS